MTPQRCRLLSCPRPGSPPPAAPPLSRPALPHAGLLAAALAVAIVLAASCAGPRGLVALQSPEASSWQDDAPPEGLVEAIGHSIAYYERLPPGTVFRYGGLVYSPEEMIRSHRLFLALRGTAENPQAFARQVAEKFHFFESIAIEGENLFTGYFEPVIPGSKAPRAGLTTPLFGMPEDLVKIDLARFGEGLPSRTLVGRVHGRQVVPYFSRREIQENGALAGRAEPLAYVNEVDLFFLQIQGSGLVQLPDGSQLRVSYAASNGHPYRSIGAILIRQEALTREEVSLQTIRAYLAAHPGAVRPLLFANPSYVFFAPEERGPLGNIRVPLTGGRSLALDHRLFPKGGLAYIETEAAPSGAVAPTRPLRRFMVVQDTGGVIRGHGRADVFWGKGPDAEWIAGHMKYPGRLFLLVAKKAFLKPPASATGAPPRLPAQPSQSG